MTPPADLPEQTAGPGHKGPLPPVPDSAYDADSTPLDAVDVPEAPAIDGDQAGNPDDLIGGFADPQVDLPPSDDPDDDSPDDE